MKNFLTIGLISFLSILIMNCGGGSGSGKQYPRFSSNDNEIVDFSFPVSKNPDLPGDISGVITDSVITIDVPHSANLTTLIAEYTTNSSRVEIKGTTQSSGITSNDFSAPVEYTVTAENGDKKIYSVVVRKAPSDEKKLISFSLNGNAAEINQSTGAVSVELPARTTLLALKASFSSAGKTVTVGEVVQESGVTENNFSIPVKYTVTADDGSIKDYTVTAVLLKDTAKELVSFGFKKTINPSLSADVELLNPESDISVVLPFGSDRNSLKASFESSGETVKVNGTAQESGLSANNFSTTVEYIVTAENGDTRKYTVNVSVAKSDAKTITQYILDGETAAIDENAKTIAVLFPSTKDLSSLTASFITTGVSLTAGSAGQVSGVTKNNFSSPVEYTVTADDGSIAVYTVKAEKTEAIAGIWNFEYGTDGSYTVSGASVVDGILGKGLYFNKGNYVLVPDSDYLTLAKEGSIEAVIKADSHQPFAGIVHKGVKKDFSDESYSLQFWGTNGTDGTLRFSVFNQAGGYAFVESSTKLATGSWYYVTATWNATEIKLYVNGVLEDSVPNTIGEIRDSAGGLVIGAQLPVIYSSSWSNLVFNGTIDRVQINSRALTDTEISDRYKSMPVALKSSLTAYILAVASKNFTVIGAVFGILILVLTAIFIINRKRAKSSC
jgi:hypothetical protein